MLKSTIPVTRRTPAMKDQYWFLKNCQLFSQLTNNDLDTLESRSRIRKFPAKTSVYLPVDQSDGLFVLVEGQVRICSLTPDGKQSILTFIEPGEVFGELALFQSGNREECAETVVKSTIVHIPTIAMQEVLQRSPQLALGITRVVGFRRQRIERRLKYLLFRSNRERLVHLLLELAEDFGRPDAEGNVALGVRLSHQDLASVIGSTRESVTVILGQLQSEGLVSLGRRRIVINALGRLARSVNVEPPTMQQPAAGGFLGAPRMIGDVAG